MKDISTVLARVFLSLIFLASAFNKISNFEGTQEYMVSKGMPATKFLLIGAILLLVFGGLSVLLGYKAKKGALLLIIFLIPATLIFHRDFSQQIEMIMFMKNLAILGGLLMIFANGAGKYSVDGR